MAKSENKTNEYRCDNCGTTFSSLSELREHEKMCEPIERREEPKQDPDSQTNQDIRQSQQTRRDDPRVR